MSYRTDCSNTILACKVTTFFAHTQIPLCQRIPRINFGMLFLVPIYILFCLIFIFLFYSLRPVLLLSAHRPYYVISM